jgi:pimeloyl-ACP methyl ester carboxylesterase
MDKRLPSSSTRPSSSADTMVEQNYFCAIDYLFVVFCIILLQKIIEMQPSGPYLISGYSFGACIAIEVVLQLPSVAQLILLDGSHYYIATQLKQYRTKFNEPEYFEAAVVRFVFHIITNLLLLLRVLALYFHAAVYTRFESTSSEMNIFSFN